MHLVGVCVCRLELNISHWPGGQNWVARTCRSVSNATVNLKTTHFELVTEKSLWRAESWMKRCHHDVLPSLPKEMIHKSHNDKYLILQSWSLTKMAINKKQLQLHLEYDACNFLKLRVTHLKWHFVLEGAPEVFFPVKIGPSKISCLEIDHFFQWLWVYRSCPLTNSYKV